MCPVPVTALSHASTTLSRQQILESRYRPSPWGSSGHVIFLLKGKLNVWHGPYLKVLPIMEEKKISFIKSRDTEENLKISLEVSRIHTGQSLQVRDWGGTHL